MDTPEVTWVGQRTEAVDSFRYARPINIQSSELDAQSWSMS
jgi:hypothetical protein